MRRWYVDRDAVERVLREEASVRGQWFYSRFDLLMYESEQSLRFLLKVLLVCIAVGGVLLGQSLLSKTVPIEVSLAFSFAWLFSIYSVEHYAQQLLLPLLLPALWSRQFQGMFREDVEIGSAVEACAGEAIRAHDWRLDLILNRLSLGVRHRDPALDFRLEPLPPATLGYPRLFLRRYLLRSEVAAILFALAGLAALFELEPWTHVLLVPPLVVLTGLLLQFFWTSWRGLPELRRYADVVEAFTERSLDDGSPIVMPSPSSVKALIRALQRPNEAAVATYGRQFVGEALQFVEPYRVQVVIEEELTPLLTEVFGSPLPVALSQVLERYEPPAV